MKNIGDISMENEIRNQKTVKQKKRWTHVFIVMATIVVAFSMIIFGLPLSKMFNFEINEMAAAKFSPSYAKVFMFLLLTFLYFVVIYISQRFIHKKPFKLLGFRKPIIHQIFIAFIIGAVINLVPFIIIILTGTNIEFASSIPEGTSILRVIMAYSYFFFVFLTVNSIGEELVFRCYPIEHLLDNRKILPYAIIVVAILFALLHFIVRAPSWSGFFTLSLTSILFSLIYLNWRSIWVLVGIHNGKNFMNLTFSENWEMGGLFTWTGDAMKGIAIYLNIYNYAVPIIAIVILYLMFKRSEIKMTQEITDH